MTTKKHEIQSFMRSLPILAGVLGRKLGVKIQIGGSSASTNGKTISLPALPLDGGEELFILANGFVDHEAAHVRITDFDELRAAALTPLSHLLFNMAEDVRVEKELVKIYPGCRDHFKKMYGELIKEASPDDAAKDASRASHNITGWLMSAIFKAQYPDVAFPVEAFREAVDDQFPNLAAELERFLRPGLACASTAESIAWGKSVEAFLAQYFAQSKAKPAGQEREAPQGDPRAESGEDGDSSSSDNGGDSDARGDDAPGAGSALPERDDAPEQPEPQHEGEDAPAALPGEVPEQRDTTPAPDAKPGGEAPEPAVAGDGQHGSGDAEPDKTASDEPRPEGSDTVPSQDGEPDDGQDSVPVPEPGCETGVPSPDETGPDENGSGESQFSPGEQGSDAGDPENNDVQQEFDGAQGNAGDHADEPSGGNDSCSDADSDQGDAVSSDEDGRPDDGYADERPGGQDSRSTGDDPGSDASGDGNEPDDNGSSSVAGPGKTVCDAESSADGSGDGSGAGNGAPAPGIEPEDSGGQHGPENDPAAGTDSLHIPQSGDSNASPSSAGIDMLERMIQGDAAHEIEEDARKSLGAMVNSEGEMPWSFGGLLKDILEKVSQKSWGGECLQVAVAKGQPLDEMPRPLIENAQSATKVLATRLSGLLQTQTLDRIHTGRRGRIDGNRLHRLAVENPRVFKQAAEKQSANTAVHILLDRSGSMDRCMSLANAACYSVASALHRIRGVNVGVTSFPGEWDPEERYTVYPILKHGQRMHTRFAARAHGGTPMGEALWWTCQQMMGVKEDRRIILLITDGYPDSSRNTEAAMETARNMGFEIIGIGIGEHGSFIRNLIVNSRVINDIQELAPAMFGVLQQALTKNG